MDHRFFLKECRSMFVRLLILALLLCIPIVCHSANEASSAMGSPDVLVLVLSGMGPYDKVSINYASDVSDKGAEADLKKLVRATRWQVRDPKLTTETSNTPGAKPTTSVSFDTPRVVSLAEGILPVEPFVNVFKRFKTIRINYLMTSPFKLAGLRDFENEFVKVSLKQTGNSYQYTVSVKNSEFDRAGLPAQSATQAGTSQPRAGISTSKRIILTVGLALLGSVFVYFMAAYICKRRRTRE
ncbi:MAG: hypothetical protein ACYC64_13750 [Armatimonadota bacterium]